MRGKIGEKITLTLVRDGGAPFDVTLTRATIQLKSGPDLIYDVLRTTALWNLCPWDLRFDVTEATLAQTKWTHNDVLPRKSSAVPKS